MALASALVTARNSLRATSAQMNIVSQNIAGARDPNYNHRITGTQNGPNGYIYTTVEREENHPLLVNFMSKTTSAASAGAIAQGISRMSEVYSGEDFSDSPAKRIAEFRDALQLYYNQYEQVDAGNAAIAAAKKLVTSLNYGNDEMAKLRMDADREIEARVGEVNDLLVRFHEINEQVVKATMTGRDAGDYLDQRDALLKDLSEHIGVTTVAHGDGSMSLYGADGSTLYDKGPRPLSFVPAVALPSGVQGNMVMVDGVPLDHGSFRDPSGGGAIGGLLKLRDEIVPRYQAQLDEMAGALADMFKGPPDLFLDGGDAAHTGLAGRIALNETVFDVSAGGLASNLGSRDQILALVDKFGEARNYNPAAGISGTPNILEFTESSRAWIEAERKQAVSVAAFQETQWVRAGDTLSNATAVNSDVEMALMLQLEQSYAATARLVASVGKMFDSLMAAV